MAVSNCHAQEILYPLLAVIIARLFAWWITHKSEKRIEAISDRSIRNQHNKKNTYEYRLIWRQQAKKGKNQKNTAQMRHSCALSGRKQPQALIRQHLFPLSILMERGPGGEARRNNRDKPAWNATIRSTRRSIVICCCTSPLV